MRMSEEASEIPSSTLHLPAPADELRPGADASELGLKQESRYLIRSFVYQTQRN
jgi:hypothetical protein